MGITKKNGTVISKHSKKISEKCKKITPRFKFSLSNSENSVKEVAYLKDGKFTKEQITSVLKYPIPSHKSKKYLTKHTVILTKSNKKLQIINLNNGNIICKDFL